MGYLLNGVWHDGWYDTRKTGGEFVRSGAAFRERISADGTSGFPAEPLEAYERRGHMGLAGMRERIGALGGSVRTLQAPGGGALVEVSVPVDGVGRS